MDLKRLLDIEPWQWPEDAGERVAAVLRDGEAGLEDRLVAVELAGDDTVINDELAGLLVTIVADGNEPDDLRAAAAISLGPGLESAYMFGDDEEVDDPLFPDDDEMPFSHEMWQLIQQALRAVFEDDAVPMEVRRRALEASVRSPEGWHEAAIREAWESDDEDRRLTAVFGMGHVRGFEQEILEALESGNDDIRFHAVCAAGIWEVGEAWLEIVEILDGEEDKDLLIAAFGAAAAINPEEAPELLGRYLDSDDEDIVESAHEAMSMARGLLGEDDDEGWDDEPVH